MANGTIAFQNRIPRAVLDETGWSPTAPLANTKTLPLKNYALSSSYGTENSPLIIRGVLDAQYTISYGGFCDINAQQFGSYRLRLFADDSWNELVFDNINSETGIVEPVIPPIYEPLQLRWNDDNLFHGGLKEEDYQALLTNIHVVVPECPTRSFEWHINDVGYVINDEGGISDAGYLQIGHLWLSDAITFKTNFAPGAENILNSTDEIERNVSGTWIEPGTGYRSAEIPLEHIERAQSELLANMMANIRNHKPIVWLPDPEDRAYSWRYGFYGTSSSKSTRFRRKTYGIDSTTLQFEEITS